ncbi:MULTISPECIES: NTP transferase domain-containing protein [unclassified Bordetella]|uniref:nucleotidyltransferase family protein n=1 Tax=unclassified Bordetella TaxID=2630031 RepID=UPI0013216DE6|nr:MULTISPECIES: nucleotidyltransferase family protein [unclassified Bordetella]MVW73179.1 NTP transferase domain-containing protein [Bordetella sp. 15P40C-2]MVW79903.1 NTP transferase domain-containing protein [Bordetella sp. 02P26C-1]
MTLTAAPAKSMFVGILLAAGLGERFTAASTGRLPTTTHKLLAAMPDGRRVAQASAQSLLRAVPQSVAVVAGRPAGLADLLAELGCELVHVADSPRGMGISLAAAAAHWIARHKDGLEISACVVALADMPWVRTDTIRTLLDHAEATRIVVPVYQGRRGHPVVFGASYFSDLAELQGDAGAKALLQRYGVKEVECDDPGILRDIDVPGDLMMC